MLDGEAMRWPDPRLRKVSRWFEGVKKKILGKRAEK